MEQILPPEGESLEDIVDLLQDKPILTGESMFDVALHRGCALGNEGRAQLTLMLEVSVQSPLADSGGQPDLMHADVVDAVFVK